MATFRKGILGGFTGLIGTAIGTKWRRKDIMKGRYKVKKKKKKDTEQSLKVALVSTFLSPFKEIIRLGFHNRKQQDTASTIAKKYHLAHAIKGEMPNFEIDCSKVVLSKGNRETAWAARVQRKNARLLRLTWEIPVTADIKMIAKDIVHVIAYKEISGSCTAFCDGSTRDILIYDFPVGNIKPGETVHFWIFFTSPDGRNISNSDYVGSMSTPKETGEEILVPSAL